ncbi:MAG: phosphonoacetaldehyde hydrolase [Anaerolineae bacterium]
MRVRVQGLIFDWAGTTVDYGCIAPTQAFMRLFADYGMTITLEEARGPMGMAKRDHIAHVLNLPRVSDQWQQTKNRQPTDDDVSAMYKDFIPAQTAALLERAEPIPGVIETVAALRAMGLKIGSNTGYTRSMVEALIPAAAKHGYSPDVVVVPEDVGAGRPAPFMAFEIARKLGLYPMWTLIKVGDTVVDIEEAINAGMWGVAVAKTGNEIGLSEAEVTALPPDELAAKLESARKNSRMQGRIT